MSGTVSKPIRVDKDLAEWFDSNFPWRGSFPQFVGAALAEFKKEWEKEGRKAPHELLSTAMASYTRKA